MSLQKPFSIGIVGHGVVGTAVACGFAPISDVWIYDKNRPVHTLREVVENSEFIFLCVPTPVKPDHSIDLSIMDEVIGQISTLTDGVGKILVIKSTVVPCTAQRYRLRFPLLHIVNNPEFLTDRTANLDFINPSRIVIGGDREDCDRLAELYRTRIGHSPIFIVSHIEAELCKYTANCFYATKISYFNEIYQMCQKLGADYDVVKNITLASGWVGNEHVSVPGPDGKLGWGGSCFPKDTQAFYERAKELGIDMLTLKGAMESNNRVRTFTHAEAVGLKNAPEFDKK